MTQITYTDPPILLWDNTKSTWALQNSFGVWRNGTWVTTLQRGFETDLASIPRIIRSITPQIGHHIQAAIVHDFIYRDPGAKVRWSREAADRLFYDGMKSLGVYWLRRWVMYLGVRAFGGLSWRKK